MNGRDADNTSFVHFPKLHSCCTSKFWDFPSPSFSNHTKVHICRPNSSRALQKYLVTFLLNLECSIQTTGAPNNDLHRTLILAEKALLRGPEDFICMWLNESYVHPLIQELWKAIITLITLVSTRSLTLLFLVETIQSRRVDEGNVLAS